MEQASTSSSSAGNPLSHGTLRRNVRSQSPEDYLLDIPQWCSTAYPHLFNTSADCTIHYLDEYRKEYCDGASSDTSEDDDDEIIEPQEQYDDMENSLPKYLIFSTGSKTYTPHQIGIKRIRHVTFPKKLDPGPSLKERIAAKKKAAEEQVNKECIKNIITLIIMLSHRIIHHVLIRIGGTMKLLQTDLIK